jgi:hypothetical protein
MGNQVSVAPCSVGSGWFACSSKKSAWHGNPGVTLHEIRRLRARVRGLPFRCKILGSDKKGKEARPYSASRADPVEQGRDERTNSLKASGAAVINESKDDQNRTSTRSC